MADTELKTEVVLGATDKMTPVADTIAAAFNKAHHAATHLGEKVSEIGKHVLFSTAGQLGIGLGIHAIAEKVLEAQTEMGHMKKQIISTHVAFETWRKDISIPERIKIAGEEANEVFEKMEKTSMRLAIPAEELGNAYQLVAIPAMQKLGLSQEQTLQLMTRSAEAAKTFGVSSETAAMTLTRALITGTVRGGDPLGLSLKNALGNMTKLSAPERFKRLNAQFGQFTLTADAMATGFGATMFRARKSFTDFIRDASTPIFKYIADKISSWQKALEASGSSMKELAEHWGDKLLNGFQAMEKVASFLVGHWKEIAIIIGGIKMGGLVSGAAQGAGGFLSTLTGPAAVAGGKLASFGAALPGVTAGLALLYGGLTLAADALDEWQGKNLKAADQGQGVTEVLELISKGNEKGALKVAESFGLVDQATGKLAMSAEQLQEKFDQLDPDKVRTLMKAFDFTGGASEEKAGATAHARLMELINNTFDFAATAFKMVPDETLGPMAKFAGAQKDTRPIHPTGPVINQNFSGGITIKQDFKDADPDRVFVRFKNDLESLSDRRKQSREADVHGT